MSLDEIVRRAVDECMGPNVSVQLIEGSPDEIVFRVGGREVSIAGDYADGIRVEHIVDGLRQLRIAPLPVA